LYPPRRASLDRILVCALQAMLAAQGRRRRELAAAPGFRASPQIASTRRRDIPMTTSEACIGVHGRR
jgi:hypothetical protein